MNEVLANLYAITGETKYLRRRKFDHKVIFERSRAADRSRACMRTQIEIIGAARECS